MNNQITKITLLSCLCFFLTQQVFSQRVTSAGLSLTFDGLAYVVEMVITDVDNGTLPITNLSASQVSIVVPSAISDQDFNISSVNGGSWGVSPGSTTAINGSENVVAISTNGARIDGAGVGAVQLFTFTLDGGCNENLRLFNNNTVVPGDLDFDHNLDVVLSGNVYNLSNTNNVVCVALPVELLDFRVKVVSSQKVLLDWETATESNNDFFVVERSGDNLQFEKLLQVAGAGTTMDPQQYATQDVAPLQGDNYYRLKQVDYDGSFSYSEIRHVRFKVRELAAEVRVYPNPTSAFLTIRFLETLPDKGQMELYDIQGRVVKSQVSDQVSHLLEWDLRDLAKGTYLLRIPLTEGVLTRKIVLE